MSEDGPLVRVRLFAALRDMAGASVITARGDTVQQVIDNVGLQAGEDFTRLAPYCAVFRHEEPTVRDAALVDGDEIALLPPVSGG